MKQGAIFDMDGLMFDTERLWQSAWRELARANGYEPSSDFGREISGTAGEVMYAVIRKYYPTVDAPAFAAGATGKVERRLEREVPIKPGLFDILNYFRDHGVPMAVASSSMPETILRNLRNADVEEYFSVIMSSTEVANPKPEPDVFLEAARRLGLPPQECYVFEDSFGGVRAGAAAGCCTVMIPDMVEPTDELRALCGGVYENLTLAAKAIHAGEI